MIAVNNPVRSASLDLAKITVDAGTALATAMQDDRVLSLVRGQHEPEDAFILRRRDMLLDTAADIFMDVYCGEYTKEDAKRFVDRVLDQSIRGLGAVAVAQRRLSQRSVLVYS
jgi:hypothetical protein